MKSHFFFQYCQKLVILSADKKSVLLARRQGEADYDGIYSFIGGKMETTDKSLLEGMRREKTEEIGTNAVVKILPNETYNFLYTKKDGSSMILPHIPGIFISGDIILNKEYSGYKWVPIAGLEAFEPKIGGIPDQTNWALNKLKTADESQLVKI